MWTWRITVAKAFRQEKSGKMSHYPQPDPRLVVRIVPINTYWWPMKKATGQNRKWIPFYLESNSISRCLLTLINSSFVAFRIHFQLANTLANTLPNFLSYCFFLTVYVQFCHKNLILDQWSCIVLNPICSNLPSSKLELSLQLSPCLKSFWKELTDEDPALSWSTESTLTPLFILFSFLLFSSLK